MNSSPSSRSSSLLIRWTNNMLWTPQSTLSVHKIMQELKHFQILLKAANLNTLASDLTMGFSIIPLRKIRSISSAPVDVGRSVRLSKTCCMAADKTKTKSKYWPKQASIRSKSSGKRNINFKDENKGTEQKKNFFCGVSENEIQVTFNWIQAQHIPSKICY